MTSKRRQRQAGQREWRLNGWIESKVGVEKRGRARHTPLAHHPNEAEAPIVTSTAMGACPLRRGLGLPPLPLERQRGERPKCRGVAARGTGRGYDEE